MVKIHSAAQLKNFFFDCDGVDDIVKRHILKCGVADSTELGKSEWIKICSECVDKYTNLAKAVREVCGFFDGGGEYSLELGESVQQGRFSSLYDINSTIAGAKAGWKYEKKHLEQMESPFCEEI